MDFGNPTCPASKLFPFRIWVHYSSCLPYSRAMAVNITFGECMYSRPEAFTRKNTSLHLADCLEGFVHKGEIVLHCMHEAFGCLMPVYIVLLRTICILFETCGSSWSPISMSSLVDVGVRCAVLFLVCFLFSLSRHDQKSWTKTEHHIDQELNSFAFLIEDPAQVRCCFPTKSNEVELPQVTKNLPDCLGISMA